ncbi:hypothetical protein WJX72_010659 [[Myrmecia] bisecta]|uniref:Uncharacterized protein n=1 Tax=[Myrmecia] bisecta TaxID=41462 RepID=A0AAW1PE14_9CHLO
MATVPTMPAQTVRLGSFTLLGLGAVSWLISLAGVSAVTKVLGTSEPVGFFWWVVFANLFVYVLVGLTLAMNYHASRASVLALLAVVTALTMALTDSANSLRRGAFEKSRFDCLFAGFLLMSIVDGLLIFFVGHDAGGEHVAATTHTAHTVPATRPAVDKPTAPVAV